MKKLLLIFALLSLSACSTTRVQLTSDKYLNPNDQDISVPVEVKLFTLTDNQKFQNAAFEDLWQREKQVLGKTLVYEKILMLSPSKQITVKLKRNSSSKFIAAIAIFRNRDMSYWRAINKINNIEKISFKLKGNRIGLTKNDV